MSNKQFKSLSSILILGFIMLGAYTSSVINDFMAHGIYIGFYVVFMLYLFYTPNLKDD